MRRLLWLLPLVLLSSRLFAYTYVTTCTNGAQPVTSISCNVTVATHQTIIGFGVQGNALSTGSIFSDTSGCVWTGTNIAGADLNGISGHIFIGGCGTGSFSGTDTVTVSSGGSADYMYLRVLVYDVGTDPTFDFTGAQIGGPGSQGCSTSDSFQYATHNTNELLFAAHMWGGANPTTNTFTGGGGETVRVNSPSEFVIPLSSTNLMGILVEDQLTGPISSFTTNATATVAANCWQVATIAVKTSTSTSEFFGEPRRRISN